MSSDKIDTITMDVPLFIRMLEFSREDAKDDVTLHKVVQNALNLHQKGIEILNIENYNKIIDMSGLSKSVKIKDVKFEGNKTNDGRTV